MSTNQLQIHLPRKARRTAPTRPRRPRRLHRAVAIAPPRPLSRLQRPQLRLIVAEHLQVVIESRIVQVRARTRLPAGRNSHQPLEAPLRDGPLYSLKTTREGIFAHTQESRVFDSVRFEAYQRLNGGSYAPGNALPFPDGKGYALTVSRQIEKKALLEAGFANIDLSYTSYIGIDVQAVILGLTVNGDQYGLGKRYFVRPSIPITRSLSLTGNFSHIFDTTAAAKKDSLTIWNAQALTVGLVFDARKAFFPESRAN